LPSLTVIKGAAIDILAAVFKCNSPCKRTINGLSTLTARFSKITLLNLFIHFLGSSRQLIKQYNQIEIIPFFQLAEINNSF
jgi:hypothetical protein